MSQDKNIKYIACSQCGTFPDEATAIRFRRVCKILDLQKFVPDDDMELYRCMFPVLGIMARTLEKQKAATTEANKRMAELESIAAEQKIIISGLKGECQDLGVTDICIALGRKDTQIAELQASNNHLREALEEVKRNSYQQSVGGGDVGIVTCEALEKVEQALSATPAESLQAFENEVLERAAIICDSLQGAGWNAIAAERIRALKEVK